MNILTFYIPPHPEISLQLINLFRLEDRIISRNINIDYILFTSQGINRVCRCRFNRLKAYGDQRDYK